MQQTMQSDSEDPVLKLAARLHKYDLRISSGAIGGLNTVRNFRHLPIGWRCSHMQWSLLVAGILTLVVTTQVSHKGNTKKCG